jgi:serine/threonine protein kinase
MNIKAYTYDDIITIKQIGKGAYGSVDQILLINNRDLQLALKKIKKNEVIESTLFRELIFLNYLNGKHFTKFYGTCGENGLILEKFGDTIHNTIILKNKKFTKINYLRIFYNILKAYHELHSYGIMHSDIKHDNILINMDDLNVKIIDFGISSYLGIGPEVSEITYYLSNSFGKASDERKSYNSEVYGLARTFLAILYRRYDHFIIDDINNEEDIKYITIGVSADFHDLLNHMLVEDINTRYSVLESINHKCFDDIRENDLGGGFRKNYVYNKSEYDNKYYELTCLDENINNAKRYNIKLNEISEENKKMMIDTLSVIYTLDVTYQSIFNSILYVRNTLIDIKENTKINDVFNIINFYLHGYSYIDNTLFVELEENNDNIKLSEYMFTKKPDVNFLPIETIIQYLYIFHKFVNNKFDDVDYYEYQNNMYKNIINWILNENMTLEFNLYDLCLHIFNNLYKFNILKSTLDK